VAQICRIARRAGFDIIEPGSMAVAEQIAAFKAARVVIAPIGASMANLIFTPRGCKVICLSPVYEGANYFYWSNFMSALGHDITYVIGPQVSKTGHLFHRDYEVNVDDFYTALSGALNSAPV
jgi:capsular polysaccharide biosynthesis protein